MRRGLRATAVVVGLAVVGSSTALALVGSAPARASMPARWSGEVVAAPRPDTPDDPAAVAALRRAAVAARATAYSGVAAMEEWTGGGGVSRVVDVVRTPGVGTTVTVRGEAAPPLVTRDDDGVPGSAPFADAGRLLWLLAANFAVAVTGEGIVAGRPALVVTARRADGRLAARFWIDRSTGLVLRREVYDAAGRTSSAAVFLSLDVRERTGTGAAAALAPDPGPGPAGASAADSARTYLADFRAEGWRCPEALPNGLTLVGARRGADGRHLQLVFSDGLTTLSLFEQRGRLDPTGLDSFTRTDVAGVAAWTRPGMPAQVVWQSGDAVFTAVGDAPGDVIAAVVAALTGEPAADDGVLARMRRGVDRLLHLVRG